MKKISFAFALLLSLADLQLSAQTGKTLYAQDFSTGAIPASWTTTSETANPFNWSFSNPLGRTIESPTAINGFAIADRAYFGNVYLKASLTSKVLDFTSNSKVYLEFYHQLAGLGAGDTAELQVSVDNGTNWSNVELIPASTTGTVKRNIDLSSRVAGQSQVKVRFRFLSNHDAYWIIDDLRFYTLYSNDLSITSLLAPQTGCSLGSAETVTIRVKNQGLDPVSSFQAYYSGAPGPQVSETVTLSLAPGEEKDYSFTAKADLSVAGSYTLNAWIFLPNDSDETNDYSNGNRVYSLHYDIHSTAYSTGFEGIADPSFPMYTTIGSDGDNNAWGPGISSGQAHNSSNGMLLTHMADGLSNWLFSHCFIMQSSDTYTLSFWYRTDETGTSGKLGLYVGDAPALAAMNKKITEVALDGTPGWKQMAINFTPPSSGTWYLGWLAEGSSAQNFWLALDDVSLNKAADHDLGVVTGLINASGCYPDSVPLQVAIYNFGSNTETDFFVSCRVNELSYLTEQVHVSLNTSDTSWYTFSKKIPLVPGYNTKLEVYTILGTDANTANDKFSQTTTNTSLDVTHGSFSYNFESYNNPEAISLINGNQDPYEWWIQSSPVISGSGALVYYTPANVPANEWLLENNCLFLKKGVSYRFSFAYRNSASNYSLDFFLGNAPDTFAMNRHIRHMDLNMIIGGYSNAAFSFGVPEDGIYYLAFRLNGSEANQFVIDNLLLSFGMDNDIGPVALLSPQTSCELDDSAYVTGAFTNLGNAPVSNFYVGFSIGGSQMEKILVPGPLAPTDTFVHQFSIPAHFEYSGETQIGLFTELTGDPYYDNDDLYFMVERLNLDLETNPYFSSFSSSEAKYFSLIDLNEDGNTWTPSDYNGGLHYESLTGDANEAVISRCLKLKAGQVYVAKFRPEIINTIPEFRLLAGGGTDIGSMTLFADWKNLVMQYNPDGNESLEYSSYFTVPSDGIYHIGMQLLGSSPTYYSMSISYLQVYKAPQQDAAAISILSPVTSCSLGTEETVSVKIANLGSEPLVNPLVSICLDPDPEGGICMQSLEEEYNGTIQPFDTVEFTFAGTLDLSTPGYHQVNLTFAGGMDEDPGNNTFISTVQNGIDFMRNGYNGSFYSETGRSDWLIADVDGDGASWRYSYDLMNGWNTNCAAGSVESNDWLFSRCLNFEAGNYYKILFSAWTDSEHSGLSLHMGMERNPGSMDRSLFQEEKLKTFNIEMADSNLYSAYIHCTESGLYYLGFHAEGSPEADSIHLAWVNVNGMKGQDLATMTLVSPVSGCGFVESQPVRVIFMSQGADTLRNIPVFYAVNNGTEIKDTLPLLLPGESKEFEFTQPMDTRIAGVSFSLDVWGSAPGDDEPANDRLTMDKIYNFASDTLSWNYLMGFEEGESMMDYYLGFGATTQVVCSQGMMPPHSGNCVMGIGNLYSTTLDAGIATHCFRLLGGREYTLGFGSRLIFSDEGVNQSVYLATAPDLGSVTDTLSESILTAAEYEMVNTSFKPATSSTYYLVWHFEGNFNSINGVLLDDVSLQLLNAGVHQPGSRDGLLRVYPNPAADHLYVQVPEEAGKGAFGEIINLLGETVSRMDRLVPGERTRFDIAALPRGSYLIRIQGTQAAWQQKFIIR